MAQKGIIASVSSSRTAATITAAAAAAAAVAAVVRATLPAIGETAAIHVPEMAGGGTDGDCGVRDGSIKTVEQQRCLCPAGAPPLGGGLMAVMAPLGHQQREAECSSDLSMW